MAERPNLDEDKGRKANNHTLFRGCQTHGEVLLVSSYFLDIALLAGRPKSRKVPPSPLQELKHVSIRRLCLKILWECDFTEPAETWIFASTQIPDRFCHLPPLLELNKWSPETLKETTDEINQESLPEYKASGINSLKINGLLQNANVNELEEDSSSKLSRFQQDIA
ncbi:hypothetical protein Tco_1404606 [Tanacetum coccineum]